jgi:hypothetical protein
VSYATIVWLFRERLVLAKAIDELDTSRNRLRARKSILKENFRDTMR